MIEDSTRIPKIGHICWFGPHDPPQEAMDTWINNNPGIMWSLWRDHTTGWMDQEHINARAAKQEWNGVCDIIRYQLLYKFGGICVDADSASVKPLVEGDFFDRETAVACYEHEEVRPGMIGCGFMGAPKGHPFMEACVDEAHGQDPREAAWKTVGPMLITKIAKEMPDQIHVYPARSFNPEHYSGAKAPGTHPIFGFQYWAGTTGYNKMRKWSCQCNVCRNTQSMLRPSWG